MDYQATREQIEAHRRWLIAGGATAHRFEIALCDMALRAFDRVQLLHERDTAWSQLREIREAIGADPEESTADEVRRVVAQRDELLEAIQSLARDANVGNEGPAEIVGHVVRRLQEVERLRERAERAEAEASRIREIVGNQVCEQWCPALRGADCVDRGMCSCWYRSALQSPPPASEVPIHHEVVPGRGWVAPDDPEHPDYEHVIGATDPAPASEQRMWQHEETGRVTEAAECPGPRWFEIPNDAAPADRPEPGQEALEAACAYYWKHTGRGAEWANLSEWRRAHYMDSMRGAIRQAIDTEDRPEPSEALEAFEREKSASEAQRACDKVDELIRARITDPAIIDPNMNIIRGFIESQPAPAVPESVLALADELAPHEVITGEDEIYQRVANRLRALADSAPAVPDAVRQLPGSLRESARLCRDPQFGPNEQMARGFEKSADAIERALADSAQGAVPPRMNVHPEMGSVAQTAYANGWNDCRRRVIAAAPKPEGSQS